MSEPPSVGGRRSRGGGSAPRRSAQGDAAEAGFSGSSLIRGYPPVLGAMLLVDGILTVILGGDATVSLGEVVAYLLLPPLAMFLLTQLTGGRRPNAVTIGAGVAGGAIIFAALFLGGGVHLLTLPGWLLALVGLLLLGVAVFLMRRNVAAPPVAPLSPPMERDEYDGPPQASATHSAGPPEPEWPPRRDPASWSDWSDTAAAEAQPSYPSAGAQPLYPAAETRPSYPAGEVQPSYQAGEARPGWSTGPPEREWPPGPAANEWPPRRDPEPAAAGWPAHHDPEPAADEWPAHRDPEPAVPGWPAHRDPEPAPGEWPPRRDHEPAPDAQRSWFDTDEAQPAEPAQPAWPADPSDRDWPPTSGGRRSRQPDH